MNRWRKGKMKEDSNEQKRRIDKMKDGMGEWKDKMMVQ